MAAGSGDMKLQRQTAGPWQRGLARGERGRAGGEEEGEKTRVKECLSTSFSPMLPHTDQSGPASFPFTRVSTPIRDAEKEENMPSVGAVIGLA